METLFRPTAEDRKAMSHFTSPAKKADEIASAAETAGDANLHFLAGKAYEFADDAPPDLEKAMEQYRKAAARGHPEATVRVAWLLIRNDDSPATRQRALKMAEEAAQKGNLTATLTFHGMLSLGFGGESRKAEGFKGIRKLAEEGWPEAEYLLGGIYLEGVDGKKNPAEAFEWTRRAAEHGHPSAQLNLGICYGHGIGVERSPETAFRWYLAAAEQGDTDAQHNIGNAYMRGTGVPVDRVKAIFWYRKSAARGAAESMVAMALCLLDTNPNPDPEMTAEILHWLTKAGELKNPLANYSLAHCYFEGKIAPFDFSKGVAHLTEAAESGLPPAQLQLAQLLHFGHPEGLKGDKIECLKWTMIAANAGYIPAKNYLVELTPTLSAKDLQIASERAAAFKPAAADSSMYGKLGYRPKIDEME